MPRGSGCRRFRRPNAPKPARRLYLRVDKGEFMNATIKVMFCAAALAAAGQAWPQGEGMIQGFYKNIPMQSRGATIATLGLPAGKFIVTVTAEAVAYLNATASVNGGAFTPAGTGYAPYGINVPGTGATVTATTGIVLSAPGNGTLACNVNGPAGNNGLSIRGSTTAGGGPEV